MRKTQVNVYLDPETLRKIDSDAAAEDRSRSWVIADLVRGHYRDRAPGGVKLPRDVPVPRRAPR